MRHRDNNIPQNPHTALVRGWQRRLHTIGGEILKEYQELHVSADTASRVMYAEYLVTTANFLQMADEMLSEHIEVIERNEAWDEAQKRKHK